MSFADGSRLGPYRIIRKLGEGGMGEVYEALHEAIERRVAIKVLHAEFAREPEIANRFANEARAVNRIGHPGLVQVSDYSQHTDGRSYIVMEYLEGENLSARLVRCGGRLPIKDAVRLCRQIGSALIAAHNKGIIHRDLKPDNIMLVLDSEHVEGERVKVLDFGLAKLVDRPGTKSDVIMGTPHYMSPEQCSGAKAVTSKSDVYSLGVMLFEVLAGRLPFTAEGVGELIVMHLFNAPPPLAGIAPEVPARLAELVDLMLVKAADARPTVKRVMETLLEVLEGLPKNDSRSVARGPVAVGRAAGDAAAAADAYKPTLAGTVAPVLHLASPEVRKLFAQYLRTESDLDAFLVDYFPQVKRRFLPGMDSAAKVKLLLEVVDRGELLAKLRRAFPEAFAHLLVVENGSDAGRLYTLPCPGRFIMGRGPDADIPVPDADQMISRRHAVLDISVAGVVVHREGKYPLSVNGQAVTTSSMLVSTDRIEIGKTVFRLETVFRRYGQKLWVEDS